MPPSVKDLYLKDKEMPNISKDYSVVGFDADHCFVKYNVKVLSSYLVEMNLRDMHEKCHYPAEIMDFDYR